ncbi:MAG: efflux RND transporter permease subunit [Bdellovibrionales bacterium]|jgi:multidrug efflux pump subunit AcrB|nr:efflux RND transporter permease subunit [Bdellovibrionales bacterium]MBT3525768.1 efflux RND transporter permease subunit [Bdellovibrionales bacterium]MBT7668374.1 efflux RND transporter permease subunit [Bdellovibrionales bacterium]
MNSLISYFANRHLLANTIFMAIIMMGAFTWHTIGKEEMPEFESNWVRVTTIYPGAPAEDVELFITKPMEDELKGVVGIDELSTTSSMGVSSLRIILDDNYPDKKEVVQNIQDAVLRARLPSQVRDLPRIRQFKSSEKAILDIGIYHKEHTYLDAKSRNELQKFVLNFENQLLALNEISSISRSHYRKPELQIIIDPQKALQSEISLNQIRTQIKNSNIRVPIGSLLDRGESKVSALNELETVDDLKNLLLRGNYEGFGVKLSDISSTIDQGHIKTNSIFKVNGHEAVFLKVKKSISTDILTAQKVIIDFIKQFKLSKKDAPIGVVMMDDESFAVRNRLKIIGTNGLLGFILIILVLFIFLDVKTGFWVAMGIPFSMGFTLIIASLVGYTINNMTLAGIIIVLGIVVDDAIIIAENISRHREQGVSKRDASLIGTIEVFRPILASIITTCVAFLPLIFFEGFFGKLVTYIPLIVILMLVGSLIESLFILPSHMSGRTMLLDRFTKNDGKTHWFIRFEQLYQKLLMRIFSVRFPVILFFIAILGGAIWQFHSKMKFVMFPREESKEVFIKVKADKKSTRQETSALIGPLENYLARDTRNVVGVRSSIGLSRRGGVVKENEASILVELIPADQRDVPLNQLLARWKSFSNNLSGLKSIKYRRGRWGHGSGNAVEIQVQENSDHHREEVVKQLKSSMEAMPELADVEVDTPLKKREYILRLIQGNIIRHNVSPSSITNTLRTFVEGSILYSINKGEEEVDVRLTVPEKSKKGLDELLSLRVENKAGRLIYLKNVVKIEEVIRPVNIARTNFKRATMIYANMAPNSTSTPLQVAGQLESGIFNKLLNQFPTTILSFKGEIEDSREGQGEFRNSIIIVIIIIYLILVIMFNSLTRPFLILSAVPFGLAGVVFTLSIHGMSIYGFFAVIGALGMIGVVINDAIVMVDRMEKKIRHHHRPGEDLTQVIAQAASTRLRPVLLTTFTTVVGVLPTAYGLAGYDSMLAEMMLAMGWGLAFGTVITLILVPCLYSFTSQPSDII